MPYSNSEPKRDHNLDDHPIAEGLDLEDQNDQPCTVEELQALLKREKPQGSI